MGAHFALPYIHIWRSYMKRKIKIGNKEIMMEANGYTPCKYREEFPGRDIIIELAAVDAMDDTEWVDLGIYERLAYVMSDAPENGIEFATWLSGFGPTDIFGAAQQIMEVWSNNGKGISEDEEGDEPKKQEADES